MFVRRSTVRKPNRTYRYAHLVESYRRKEDGAPRHRVLVNLGELSDQEFENLRLALIANKAGDQVVVARERRSGAARPSKPKANLRYLDVAVGLELWREWGLGEMLAGLCPQGRAEVSFADVVCALVLQRLVDPGSKLLGTRWFPRTALPELLGISPKHFNNTRLHRVMQTLEDIRPGLMAKLPPLYRRQGSAFAALFLDVTDTWFVGHGPDVAAKGKTKEGRVERKIGIVLLCNEDGFPMRWEVVKGTRTDPDVMFEILNAMAGLNWASEAPLVVDRAMGCSAHIRSMLATDLRFLTALKTVEFPTYAANIPHAQLSDIRPQSENDPVVIADARHRILRAGMKQVKGDMLVSDLGIVTAQEDGGPVPPHDDVGVIDLTVYAIRCARAITAGVASGKFGTNRAAAKHLGITYAQCKKYRRLASLPSDVQGRVLHGEAEGYSLAALLKIASLRGSEQQRRAFTELLLAPRGRPRRTASRSPHNSVESIRVRAVLCFNPEHFVHKRYFAQRRVEQVHRFVDDLNKRLVSPRSKRKAVNVVAEIDRYLRRDNLVKAFSVAVKKVKTGGRSRLVAEVKLDEDEWARRRRHDGFALLLAHPKLTNPASEIATLYRAKDLVEKDFQTIKSMLKVRPVRHRSTQKVQAHVTLCMLALLLERTLGKKLSSSPGRALEELEACRLNLFTAKEDPAHVYTTTELTSDQERIVRALGLKHLADDEVIAERITPRA